MSRILTLSGLAVLAVAVTPVWPAWQWSAEAG